MARVVRQPLKGRRRTDQTQQHQISSDLHQTGDDDALNLIFQVFGSHDLMPITKDERIDLQITAFAAVTIQQCVQTWYGSITNDHEFILEIKAMVISLLQELYRRFKQVDLQVLAMGELPAVLDDHIQAIEYASRFHDKSAFHALRPHPALASSDNAHKWSQMIVAKALPLLLDPNDANNPALRVLLSEVISELIIYRGLYQKTCKPSFIVESITRSIPRRQPVQDQSLATTLLTVWHWLVVSLIFIRGLIFQPVRKGHVNTILTARIWSLLVTLLALRERVPWLYGMAAMLQSTVLNRTPALGYELDRKLSLLGAEWLSRSDAVPNLLQQARHALFLGGAAEPARDVLRAEDVNRSFDVCSRTIVEVLPPWLRRSYFGALLVAIVELVLARLFPELE